MIHLFNWKTKLFYFFSVAPETVVVPIISCIFGFPLLALLVICCLRRRAKMAREQARRRNCELNNGTFSIIRFSPIHYLGNQRWLLFHRTPFLNVLSTILTIADPHPHHSYKFRTSMNLNERKSLTDAKSALISVQ